MIPGPVRRSASPMAQAQAQAQAPHPPQFIYATPPAPFTSQPHPQMATTTQHAMASSATQTGPDGKPLFLCQPFVRAALVTGKFKSIVVLPKYVDVNEWVAINSE